MSENNKPRVFSTGLINPADGESVSAANNTHSIRPSSKYIYKRRDSLPYQTKQTTDSGFLASKNYADEHLKRNGLNPVWSAADLNRERAIKWSNYCETIYESQVANV
jgi:hypothetical protein